MQKICIKHCDTILHKFCTIFTTVHFANFLHLRPRNFSAQVGNKPKQNSNGSQHNQQSATNCRQYEKNSPNRQACCNRKKTPQMQNKCKKLSNLRAQSQASQKGKIIFFGYMSEKNYAGLKSNYDLQFHPKSQLRHNCVTNESQLILQLSCNWVAIESQFESQFESQLSPN